LFPEFFCEMVTEAFKHKANAFLLMNRFLFPSL